MSYIPHPQHQNKQPTSLFLSLTFIRLRRLISLSPFSFSVPHSLQKEIALLTTQLRSIEKRMLRGMRERNSRSLAATGLPILLESTYRAIFALLDELQAARAVIARYVALPLSLSVYKCTRLPPPIYGFPFPFVRERASECVFFQLYREFRECVSSFCACGVLFINNWRLCAG